ncbi:unnamed protein product [Hymenolepis diminuta]|nr:unnamed protein product [Hymenolepis diminuta]
MAVAVIRAGMIIDTTDACAKIKTRLPYNFSELRLDNKNYIFNGSKCINKENKEDTIECSVQEYCEGGFLAKAKICDVMNHYWVGFKVDKLLDGKRFGYVSVYFSHNGTWNNIYKNCIQPQLSGNTVISAGGMDYVTITCVRQLNCSNTEPQTIIMTLDESICSDYSEPKCCITDVDNMRTVVARLERPKDSGYTYAFCSANDTFLSYEIDWDSSP